MKSIILALALMISITVYGNETLRFKHPTTAIAFLNTDISVFQNSLKNQKGTLISTRSLGDKNIALISVPLGFRIDNYLADLNNNQNINKVVPNYVYKGEYREFTPNDPELSKQLHHNIIQNQKAWDISQGGSEVVVAVTDDGFKLDHEDLLDSWFINKNEIPDNGVDDDNNGYVDDVKGYDFNEQDNDPMSDSSSGSHGTHVAGIVAAGFNNSVGVSGFGENIKVMPIKFYGKNDWTSAMVLESYLYAANNGAKIITTSYYIDNFVGDQAYMKALNYAYKKGLILFNSSGNGNVEQSRRTSFTQLLLVASTRTKKSWSSKVDQKSRFSNYGSGVDISAPGDPIYSTGRSLNYVEMSGTSMASPNAAGAAAMIWSHFPNLTRDQVVARLLMSSDDLNNLNSKYENKLGSGRINTYRALMADLPPARVINTTIDQKTKEIKVHLWGILSPSSVNSRGGIILKNLDSMEIEESVQVSRPYHIGTNEIRLKLPKKGNYRLTLVASQLLDPFSRSLDGNNDGVPGENYEIELRIP